MSSEITRITSLRNRIRTKLISLGVISDSSADLEDCADGVDSITGISEYRIFEESTNTGIGGNFVINGVSYRGIYAQISSSISSFNQIKSVYITTESSNPGENIFASFGTYLDWSYMTFWYSSSNITHSAYLGSNNYGIFTENNQNYIYFKIPYLGLTNRYDLIITYII